MIDQFKRFFRRRKNTTPIDPDEIFLDSQNLPDFDTNQFEGRIEKPISSKVFLMMIFFVLFAGSILLYKLWSLQIVNGQNFRDRSDKNSLHNTLIFADRGVIYDRDNIPIVWNAINPNSSDFSLRVYATSTGLSTVLGYVKYPTKDSNGFYYQNKFNAKDGIEKIYDRVISGKDGKKITETDVKGNVISESVIEPPKDGENLNLSIDLKLQRKLYSSLLDISQRGGFRGGAAILMDVHTGEILASSNVPEYDSETMTDGSNSIKITEWLNSGRHPFLNRTIQGLYTPGSIMKLFIAMAVLREGVISPEKQILSTGSISIPNPFDPTKHSTFYDWKAHGLVNLRQAIAVSSNVYFYEVSGGYKDQKGIGIDNIDKYSQMFGFGSTTGINFFGELAGTIPSPEWKEKNFKDGEWRIGDTYNTAIGQYGFQVTPVQVVRAVSALANGGVLITPTFIKNGQSTNLALHLEALLPSVSKISLDQSFFQIVKEGMRLGVTEGTSHLLDFPYVEVASKTGTAQIGISKDLVNSWVVGFWPYKDPKYAYAVVMERGSKNNQFGAVLVMQELFDWLHIYDSQYLK